MREPVLQTERLKLIMLTPNDAVAVAAYRVRNRAHLERWEPKRDEDFYTVEKSAEALAKARQQLASGEHPEAVLELLAHTLTNKLLHAPTVALREAALTGDADLARAAERLFPAESGGDGDHEADH